MTVFYFIMWLVIFEGLLLGCLFMENHFKRQEKKNQYRRRTNP